MARTVHNTAEAALLSRLVAVEAAQTSVNIAQAKLTQAQTTTLNPENVYFQSDQVQQVFGVKLNLEQPSRLAKLGMPADAKIPLQ